MNISRTKITAILLGDIALFYIALFLSLLIRYQGEYISAAYSFLYAHVVAFSFVLIPWILGFYLFELYREKNFKPDSQTLAVFARALGVNVALAIAIFYFFFPIFGISPKTNLLIFVVVFALTDYAFRLVMGNIFVRRGMRNNVLFVGESPEMSTTMEYIKQNPQIGYSVALHLDGTDGGLDDLEDIVAERNINTLVIQSSIIKKSSTAKIVYRLLPVGVRITDFVDFYEQIFKQIPLKEIEENWFIENIKPTGALYLFMRGILERIEAVVFMILLSPIMLLAAIAVKTTSRGPIIYKQERVGKNEEPFYIYKFRSMRADAEKHGAQWSTPGDARVTKVGKFLRATHIDEFPQLWNVLRGEISFVGPRPERPEFVADLKKKIPYYEVRHLVKPGITGWAQIGYRYGSTVEDAYRKLEFDIYYLKNMSFALDVLILLKTVKTLFVNEK
ncbi:MAG: Sugar transferase, PEP-CTERM system associated family protein [Candidatus Wolfebacteria bacterium GW2011_GWC2_39_22]|uniref:Sugar transferase, PEP-CTERM system associated family protein n=1 Tax=Candidatus Wolfebacteria bacterium GW2011_GWC2_39_22 TaxID=1619013 RepID=A0A0G0N8Y9_9BACT|nr:MAG: Sugar transferase, PEP-CTERM system associated family protein [Candidatus Wolfebacteria bacterium GW2011_GWC2_39_22]HBI25810.1 polyprenyl glycosylphosphotransferase [Candidatus Wolfebacteria bacterium]